MSYKVFKVEILTFRYEYIEIISELLDSSECQFHYFNWRFTIGCNTLSTAKVIKAKLKLLNFNIKVG